MQSSLENNELPLIKQNIKRNTQHNTEQNIEHKIEDLIKLFSDTFFSQYNTRLIKGNDEPIYLPASDECGYHQIVFAHGYFSSGLHEVAHWCIAGKERRLQEDFGYWYEPDGRNKQQQQLFERAEIKPQAIEWAFCVAAGIKFNVSADNLNGYETDTDAFKHKVKEQVAFYITNGFPPRAQQFIATLQAFYSSKNNTLPNAFSLTQFA